MTNSEQNDNVVYGDQAGRDIYKTYQPVSRTLVSTLNEKLKREAERDPETKELIARLRDYTQAIDSDDPRGLKPKLEAGHKSSWYEDASRLKERFAKRVHEDNLSEAGQKLLLYAIARVEQYFRHHVKPLIDEGAPDGAIRSAILEPIVNPVLGELEENQIDLMPDEIEGIVWYLTGHCYLRWTSSA